MGNSPDPVNFNRLPLKSPAPTGSRSTTLPWSHSSWCSSYRGVKGSKFIKKLPSRHPTAKSTLRCASLCGVILRITFHKNQSPESISAVCITPQSQTAHSSVKIKIFTCLWLLFKGQSRKFFEG